MSPPKSRRPSVRQNRFRVRLGIRQHREVPNQALRPERSEQTESSDSKHALLTHRGQLGSLDCSGIFVLGIANPMATSDATELQVGLDPWQELECRAPPHRLVRAVPSGPAEFTSSFQEA